MYVIIGNSAAAVGAVEAIRRVDDRGPITLIAAEPYHTYSRPLISYYLAGKVTEEQMAYRPRDFYIQNGVKTLLGRKAEAVDTRARRVVLADGEGVAYQKLLIATGGRPFVPPVQGLDKAGVFTFTTMDDVKAMAKEATPGARAVVIGAGLIGLKAAEALIRKGLQVTVVELANRVLSAILDQEGAAIVQAHLEKQGICFLLNNTVTQVTGEERIKGVLLQDGQELACDLLVVAIGVVPNTAVATGTGIRVNRGILVDDTLCTSEADIYAAGDVSEGYDMVHGTWRVLPLLPNAYRQGEVAGLNMAGQVAKFAGGFAMNAIGLFGLPILTAGLAWPEGEGYRVLVRADEERQNYRKVVLKDDRVVGFILINQVDRAGILTSLIAAKTDVCGFEEGLLEPGFGYVHIPVELRHQRLLQGVGTGW